MKTKYYFFLIGTCLLSATSILAVKFSPKSCRTTIYVSTFGGGCVQGIVNACAFTTGNGIGCQASVKTSNNSHARKIWATSGCGSFAFPNNPKQVYFHG